MSFFDPMQASEPVSENTSGVNFSTPSQPPVSNDATVTPGSAASQSAPAGLIVEDSATELEPGQMRKSEFLDQTEEAVCRTVDAAIAGTGRTADGCPYVRYWLDFYRAKDSSHIERSIIRYAPEASRALSASGYIQFIAGRTGAAAQRWARTGEITGVPEGIPANLPGEPGQGEQSENSTDQVQFKPREGGARNVDSPLSIQNRLGRGQPLDSAVRSRMESGFGMDFSHVRTHTGNNASGLSSRMNARAFTVGNHIAFGNGQYRPGSMVGDALIAHELAHVVQQQGAQPDVAPLQTGGGQYNALESDADHSAIGVMTRLWRGTTEGMGNIAKNAVPSLRSGLRLQRCESCNDESSNELESQVEQQSDSENQSQAATETSLTGGLKGVTNADGKGWLTVKHDDGTTFPPLPQYLKVRVDKTENGREYFTIKESGRNGGYIGNKASVKQKQGGGSYLSSSLTYKGAATVEFDKSKKELKYGGSSAIATITSDDNPMPEGTHDIELPYEQHSLGSSYESQANFAQTWFRIGHSGDRFLHPGRVTLGCATVTDVAEWDKIYAYLINSRKDDKNVGTITVK